jgi:hypothetical protein
VRAVPLILAASLLAGACSSSGDDAVPTVPPTPPPTVATTTTTVPPAPVLVHAVGEVTFDPALVPGAAAAPEAALATVEPLFAADGLSVVHLTCTAFVPTADLAPGCAPEVLGGLAAAGVDVVVLTAGSLGAAGAAATADAARAFGLLPVGAGADAGAALAPALLERGGRSVAVLAVSRVGPDESFATADRPGIADGRDTDALLAAVAEARAVADVVVVSIRWGEDQAQGPQADDAALARTLAEAGAQVVLGHGARRLHRFEAHAAAALFLGLGDFVGTGDPPPTADTAVARALVAVDGTAVGCLLPATITAPGTPVLDDPATSACPGEG